MGEMLDSEGSYTTSLSQPVRFLNETEGTIQVELGNFEHGCSGGARDGRSTPIWFRWCKVTPPDSEAYFGFRGRVGATLDDDRTFVGSWMQGQHKAFKKPLVPCGPDISWIKSLVPETATTPFGIGESGVDVTLQRVELQYDRGVAIFEALYEPTASSLIARSPSRQSVESPVQCQPPWMSSERGEQDHISFHTQGFQLRRTDTDPLPSDWSWLNRIRVHSDRDYPMFYLALSWDRSEGIADCCATYHHCVPNGECSPEGAEGRCATSLKLVGPEPCIEASHRNEIV